jgi:subtilisin family serine protease
MKAILKALVVSFTVALLTGGANAAWDGQDLLVQLKPGIQSLSSLVEMKNQGFKIEALDHSAGWFRITGRNSSRATLAQLKALPGVAFVQPNYKIRLLENYRTQNVQLRNQLAAELAQRAHTLAPADNPAIPAKPATPGTGPDQFFNSQWGMKDIGVVKAWDVSRGSPDMIVAVIDTGIDYTHEDLLYNIWRNKGETGTDAQGHDKATNGVDDDNNGFIDDTIGWDFASNDNKPYDLSVDPAQLLFGGGNPGHGTHCAGNVAARADNGKGTVGVAPNIQIMALRFLTEKGEGTTANAIKAIKYAVDNGARVLSNSWGSEGEEAGDPENKALRDMVQYSQDHNSLFIAAAGNGHRGVGYDNDSDSKPGYPASYDNANIISVAAIDESNNLGSFSNWGARSVDIGAPGVKVFSTMVGNNYSDKVIDYMGVVATWDGTSMATPHVAGAAALYWSAHPEKKWNDVKDAILKSASPIPALSGKSVTGGKLNVADLMAQP